MSKRPPITTPTPADHQARAWLLGLKWDGKKRLGKWLRRVLNDQSTAARKASHRHRRYIELVGRNVVTAHAARILDPGTRFDFVPVLVGAAGLRKSSLIRTLVGEAHYCNTFVELDSRKTTDMEHLQGMWAYELAEMTMFSRADAEGVKAFISSSSDTFRAAFSRKATPHQRQFVIWGTSSHAHFIHGQESAQRRFWPVKVSAPIDLDWLQRNREQLFAEAVARYQAGKRFTPSAGQEMSVFAPEQARWARKDGAA